MYKVTTKSEQRTISYIFIDKPKIEHHINNIQQVSHLINIKLKRHRTFKHFTYIFCVSENTGQSNGWNFYKIRTGIRTFFFWVNR